jgi:hypothetical protein
MGREKGLIRRSVADPDWDWIRIQKGKKTYKHRKKLINIIFLSAGCSLLRAEGSPFGLNVLGGQGISKLKYFITKDKFFSICIFFNFWSLKSWIRIRIRIHFKCWSQIRILNPYPQHWYKDGNVHLSYKSLQISTVSLKVTVHNHTK